MVVKHGAYWPRNDDEAFFFEKFDKDLQLIGAVYQRRTGIYVACLFEKIGDPGFDLPVWNEIKPGALFDDLNEAKAHVDALLACSP